jgi:hypothetical protein
VIKTPADNNFHSYTFDLTTISGVNNNPDFAFKITSVHEPGTSFYAGAVNSYGTTGTVRLDNISISQNATLPVHLSHFAATVNSANTVALSWLTASEKNLSHFEVQRSFNGIEFTSIHSVPSLGSSHGSSYSFGDDSDLQGTVYYRLILISEDHPMEYSTVVSVKVGFKSRKLISAYPNPVKDVLTLSFPTGAQGEISIWDSQGRILFFSHKNLAELHYQIEMEKFPPGNYFLSFSGEQTKTFQSFIKQ